MISAEHSNLFDSLSRELTLDMLDEVNFLIGDYLEAFGISEELLGRRMFDELSRHLGTRQLLQLLSDVFKEIDRNDLCVWIKSHASLLPSEDVVRLEESPQRIPGNADTAMGNSLTSVDVDFCQQPSIQSDAGNTATFLLAKSAADSEAASIHDSSRYSFPGEMHPKEESLDPLDSTKERTVDDDAVGPLKMSIESPQRSSSQPNSSGDSGFSSEGGSTPSQSSSAFSNLSHLESSGSVVETELNTPIQMTTEEMKTYSDDTQIIGKGGFGTVYKGEYRNRSVAIKIGMLIQSSERQFLKERQLAFLRHTYIVPILAYTVEKKDKMLMIMYPYMENGDLTSVCENLDWRNRLRVYYQCSEGLAFLHRPVNGVRNDIIHGDIKPHNILLDVNLNARLGDVGVAAELPKGATHCTATANMVYGTVGYEDPYKPEGGKVIRRKENDIFSLGIVGIQLLKWQPAVLEEREEDGLTDEVLLRKNLFRDISPRTAQRLISSDTYFDKNVWHQDQKDSKANEEVAELILACLERPANRVSAEDVASKLKALLVTYDIPKYIFTGGKSCQYCCFNVADLNPAHILCSDTCPENCEFKRICQSCYQAAYRNPLYCPEHGRLKQFIRPEECFAILISGFDGEDEEMQKTFDDDVQAMFNVITDPRVMGFSGDNVILVNKNTMEKCEQVRNAIQKLQKKPVEMLIVYYSGHGNEIDYPELNIGKGDADNMKDSELKELLDLVNCTRLLVILDCCYAARYRVIEPHGTLENHMGWRIQLNGAGASKSADIPEEENKSVFTKHLIHAINGLHVCPCTEGEIEENAPPCRMCRKFKRLSEARGHIDIYDVVGFCSEHIKLQAENDQEEDQESNMIAGQLSGAAPLAPYNPKPFTYIFRFQNKEDSEKFHLKNLKHKPDDILCQLREKIDACCSLPKCIDYRCLQMVGLVRAKEKEIKTREELVCQFNRGHIVDVCFRSTASDLDSERHVVVFCSQHNKFTDILNSLEKAYGVWFKKEEPRQDIEAEYSCIIKCGETDEITSTWNIPSYDDEKRNFSSVLRDSVVRANALSREQLRAGHPPISGLRIDVTKEFAVMALVQIETTK